MGYFQLKSSPGLWELGVAPGRSRCVVPSPNPGPRRPPANRHPPVYPVGQLPPLTLLAPRPAHPPPRDLYGILASGSGLADSTTTYISSFSGGLAQPGAPATATIQGQAQGSPR
jgi:hypothetical protein